MNRRSFMKSILAAGVAPYVVTAPGVLMAVRKTDGGVLVPDRELARLPFWYNWQAADIDLHTGEQIRFLDQHGDWIENRTTGAVDVQAGRLVMEAKVWRA